MVIGFLNFITIALPYIEFNCETTSVIDEEIAELKIFDTANTVRIMLKLGALVSCMNRGHR